MTGGWGTPAQRERQERMNAAKARMKADFERKMAARDKEQGAASGGLGTASEPKPVLEAILETADRMRTTAKEQPACYHCCGNHEGCTHVPVRLSNSTTEKLADASDDND